MGSEVSSFETAARAAIDPGGIRGLLPEIPTVVPVVTDPIPLPVDSRPFTLPDSGAFVRTPSRPEFRPTGVGFERGAVQGFLDYPGRFRLVEVIWADDGWRLFRSESQGGVTRGARREAGGWVTPTAFTGAPAMLAIRMPSGFPRSAWPWVVSGLGGAGGRDDPPNPASLTRSGRRWRGYKVWGFVTRWSCLTVFRRFTVPWVTHGPSGGVGRLVAGGSDVHCVGFFPPR